MSSPYVTDRYDYTTLTNRERRENVAFLIEKWIAAGSRVPFTPLHPNVESKEIEHYDFFELLCYHILATQPAPESVFQADWRRLLAAAVPQQIWAGKFDIMLFALDPPVSRPDSKGKIIDFHRVSATRTTWQRLLPQPLDPDIAVDILHASSGGALKSRAFQVVADMLRQGWWHSEGLERFAHDPGARARRRAIRMGLIDLPERADTFADMKAVSRATHAVTRLGDAPQRSFSYLITENGFRCEICDAARMAACPIPHCRWRRMHAE